MSEWKPDLYLKYEMQRSLPAKDLANRLRKYHPQSILDIGCGPGNSTAILKEIFSDVKLTGIDVSESMIQKAKNLHPEINFEVCDLRKLQQKSDMIYSNACLQWVPDHRELIPYLMNQLNDHGVLAVQIPMNENEPLYRIIKETANEMPYDFTNAYFEKHDLLKPEEYAELLSECSSSAEVWETTYVHELDSHEDLLNWVRSTRLRPYLDCLTQNEQQVFEEELLKRVRKYYPVMKNGKILFRFRRFFFIAEKNVKIYKKSEKSC